MSQPPGPPYPYGGQPQQQPYGQQPPGVPPQVPYGQQPAGYGYQQPYGYPQPGGLPPGMPPLASWGARLGALLLDFLIVYLVPVGIYLAGMIPDLKRRQDALDACLDNGLKERYCDLPGATDNEVTLMVVGGILALGALIFISYREGLTGQSPGKKIVGIRVLREYDGSALGFGRGFGRQMAHILDRIPCFLGYLWPLWDSKNQTWADKMTHSVVVRDQF
ncbi:RDD family protein [Streptomyces sp. NPDC021020]|uniref:RDD family protein n=1 Tax=Streptomyces sp. NPDC021020 TaxID=3365109 RepID=UPI00378BE0E3